MNEESTNTFWKDLFTASQENVRKLQSEVATLKEESFVRNIETIALKETLAEERLKRSLDLRKIDMLERTNARLQSELSSDRAFIRRIASDHSKLNRSCDYLSIVLEEKQQVQEQLIASLNEAHAKIRNLQTENLVLQTTFSISTESQESLNNKRNLPTIAEEKTEIENMPKRPRQL